MILLVSAKRLLFGFLLSVIISLGQYSYAQIDSRNQERPDKKESTSLKKKKKVKKTKKVRNQDKGKKTYSNKKQVRRSKKSFRKGGDKGYKGGITGKKVKKTKTTPRQTYARPQPDPYAGRRIRTEKQRAGPPPKKVRTATKKGEVARSGDISGRKRIRQRSVSTNPRPVHPQPNTYRGRKKRTEKDRAYSNKKKIKNVRTVSRPSESKKPKSTTKVITATAPHRVKRKKNVYRNHEQRKGEQASTKDIAGKKIRTKNYKSKKPSRGNKAMANPIIRSDRTKTGQRFKKYNTTPSSGRSISRNGEAKGGGQPTANQRYMKNFSSAKAKSVVQPKRPRSYGNRKKGNGEAAIFGSYSAKKVRSVSKKSESKPGKRKGRAPSISGTSVFRNRKTHPYRGKDRRFSGENSTRKDIAGNTLRTRNFKSRNPDYGSVGSINFRSATGAPPNKNYNYNKAKSISGGSFNNRGNALTKRNAGLAVGSFSGKRKSSKRLQGGGSISGKWNNNGNPLNKKIGANPNIGLFAGKTKQQKPLRGGGSISTQWNNNGNSLTKRNADLAVGAFSGNIKASKKLKGGGSITRRWNNNGSPLIKKLENDPGHGSYAGNLKYQKSAKGGGSITRKWNNGGSPLMKQDRGAGTTVATTYKGNIFPRGMNNPNIGAYQGEIKSKKEKKSYPTQNFVGKVKIVSKKHSQSPGTEYGIAKKFAGIKLGSSAGLMQPSFARNKTDINTLTVKLKEREKRASAGTKLGKKTSLSFIMIGNPNIAGLVYEQKRLKVNNNLPKQLDRNQKRRVEAAPGTKRGTDWALTFWKFGSPTKMGLEKHQAKAKGKFHPSTNYKYNGNNSIDEKRKVVNVKLLWAKLFKKNAGTPEPEKEYSHKLKYDKDERVIWETDEREDWYKK